MNKSKKYRPIRKKKLFFMKKSFWLAFLSLAFFGFLSYFCLFSGSLQVGEITISGQEKVSREEIMASAEKRLERCFLNLKTKSILFLDLEKIEEGLLSDFPKIASVKIERNAPNVLILEISERIPEIRLCSEKECFFSDKEGIIFQKAEEASGLMLVEKKEFSDGLFAIKDRALEKDEIAAILKIREEAEKNAGIKLETIIIESGQKYKAGTVAGWSIYFNPESDLDWQITKLRLLLEKEINLEKNPPSEYIDLRFEKAYYK
jgi:hypothetical protein